MEKKQNIFKNQYRMLLLFSWKQENISAFLIIMSGRINVKLF